MTTVLDRLEDLYYVLRQATDQARSDDRQDVAYELWEIRGTVAAMIDHERERERKASLEE